MANFYLNYKTDLRSVISFNVNFDENNHNANHLLLAFRSFSKENSNLINPLFS